MEKLFLVLATVLVLAANGCGPQVDVAAEEAAIRAAEDEALKIAQAKDAERWASVYADDARVFPPNALLVTGKEAIRKLFAELFASPGFEIDWEVTRVEVSRAGDLGYVVGTHKVTVNDAEGNPVGEIAWSDLFNVIRDTPGVRKMGDARLDLTLNGLPADVRLNVREFPVLRTVTLVNGDTGELL